jgi:hypothetical protein
MVAPRARCPRCGNPRSWTLRNGRRRCARCRFDWRPGRLPLRLTPQQWREVLRWFVRGAPSAQIAHETRLNRKRVLRALTSVRRAILRSCPGNRRHVTDVAPGSRPKERHDAGRRGPAEVFVLSTLGLRWLHGGNRVVLLGARPAVWPLRSRSTCMDRSGDQERQGGCRQNRRQVTSLQFSTQRGGAFQIPNS